MSQIPQWGEQYGPHNRDRLNKSGEWEYEYKPLQDEAIPTTSSRKEAQISQPYSEMTNERTQTTNTERIQLPDTEKSRSKENMERSQERPQQRNNQARVKGSDVLCKTSESFDPHYKVHDTLQFKWGSVFKVLWTEPKGFSSNSKNKLNKVSDLPYTREQEAYTKIRRFVIVGRLEGKCICLPIHTYSGQVRNLRRKQTKEHRMVFSSKETCGYNKKLAIKLKDDTTNKAKDHGQHIISQQRVAYHRNCSKTYTVEHNAKVCITGHVDEKNMERLLCGDPAWERSDTGEDIPVIIENQVHPSFSCRCRRLQLLDKHAMSNTMVALLGLLSGLLMSSSIMWLNKRMELYESSQAMEKIVNAAIFHPEFVRSSSTIPNELIFALFLLGTAGLTGTTAVSSRTKGYSRLPFLGLTLAGILATWALGFSIEEIVLVCLPVIIGCLNFCCCVLRLRKREERAYVISEV